MNKWFRRAVGTVGIAGGALLLATGTAQADDSVTAAQDPQRLHGLVEDLFTPLGRAGYLGVSVDTPGHRTNAGVLPDGPLSTSANDGETGLALHAPDATGEHRDLSLHRRMPDVLGTLPISDAVPPDGLGLLPMGAPLATHPAGAEANEVGGLKAEPPVGGLPFAGVPLDELPLGEVPLDELPLGELPVGDLPGLPSGGLPGLPLDNGVGLPLGGELPVDDRPSVVPVLQDDGLHVVPRDLAGVDRDHAAEALPVGGLPLGDDLPILGDVLADRGLPVRGNLTTLPGAAPIPLGGSDDGRELLGGLPLGDLPLVGELPVRGAEAPFHTMAERPVAADENRRTEFAEELPAADALPIVAQLLNAAPGGDLPIFSAVLHRIAPAHDPAATPSPLPADILPANLIPADLVPANLIPADLVPADLLPADLVPASLVPADQPISALSSLLGG